MRAAVALALLALAPAAEAQVRPRVYLVASWFENGAQMCRYSNGTVLNVGMRFCPTSIAQ